MTTANNNFFGGKGKSKGKGNSSAKGKGRRRNPNGRDGEVMLCDVPLPSGQPCNSDAHLRADHHRFLNTSGYTGSYHQTALYQQPSADGGPIDDIFSCLLLQQAMVGCASLAVETVTPLQTAAEQGNLISRPMGTLLPGVPTTSQQGLWGEVPALSRDTRFDPQTS